MVSEVKKNWELPFFEIIENFEKGIRISFGFQNAWRNGTL
jgi:hypothetical protein